MALVTLAPIIADSVDNSRQSGIEINPFIFIKGSVVYQVTADSVSNKIAIFKGTAAGVNSLALDAANAPAFRVGGAIICYSDPTSSTISVAYRDTGTFNLAIVNFTTGIDTYGTPIISTMNSLLAFERGIGLFHRAGSGLYYVTYADNNTGLLSYRTINSGGTTSGIVTLTAAETAGQGLFYTLFDATTGIAYLFYLVSAAGGHFNCITLDNVDTVGTPVNITTDGVEWVEAIVNSSTIQVAWINGLGLKVYASSSTTVAAPVFAAAATITTVVAPVGVSYISITYDWLGNLTVFYCLVDMSFNPGIDEINYSQFISAAWTTPGVFYDAVANPPPGGLAYPSQFVHTLQTVSIALGWFSFTAMETGFCTGFILVDPGSGGSTGLTGPGTGYVFEIEKGVGRLATWEE